MTDKFNNYSNEQLADEIGKLDVTKKQIEDRLEEFKDAFKARNCSVARGDLFVVTSSTSTSQRLDTKRLREEHGDALDAYMLETTSTRLTIKPSPKLAEVA